MQEFRNRIAGLCCFNVKNDPVLMGFKKLFGESAEESFEGYSEIVGTVLMSGKTLADYFHDMLIFSDSPILNEFAYAKGETKDNFKHKLDKINNKIILQFTPISTNVNTVRINGVLNLVY